MNPIRLLARAPLDEASPSFRRIGMTLSLGQSLGGHRALSVTT